MWDLGKPEPSLNVHGMNEKKLVSIKLDLDDQSQDSNLESSKCESNVYWVH